MRSRLSKLGKIKVFPKLFLCFGVALSIAQASAETNVVGFKVEPPANWVKPQFFDRRDLAAEVESGAGEHWLLSEQQISASNNETFYHVIKQILNVSAVQDNSKLTIDFNPDYESLTMHWARIWRGPEHLDRLNTNAVKIIRREEELQDDILNGQQSALFVLDDVRVGDIIDYAYSIKGSNPLMEGHFFCAVPVQIDQPVEQFYTRILWPSRKLLYAKEQNCSVTPTVAVGKDTVEYIWNLRHMPAIQIEDSLPAWFDPEPWVELSEFKTWAEVNQWALPLFQNSAPLSPELMQKIVELKRIPDREQQVLAALRFVQDEVRYFGVEIDDNGQRPFNPSTVFARRYGDCKDKSLLFVTLLRALGIEAYPVLVNSGYRRAIGEWQPTCNAFDHCIAVLYLDGQAYWLDATMQFQRGALAAHYLPDYGYGLIISPKTTGLTAIPQTAGFSQTATTEYFQLGKKNEPATLKVVTIAVGRDADRLRTLFATNKRSDIEKNYSHFYADRYPGIKMSAPLDLTDYEMQNEIQTTEYYTIDKAWTRADKGGKYSFDCYPLTIANLLEPPADTERTMPISLSFPEHQILRTEITLPSTWQSDVINKTISDPTFSFQKNIKCFGNKVVMNFEYQSFTDFVMASQAADYILHLNQASKSLGYSITW